MVRTRTRAHDRHVDTQTLAPRFILASIKYAWFTSMYLSSGPESSANWQLGDIQVRKLMSEWASGMLGWVGSHVAVRMVL
jgi:hypothetical protein